MWKVPGERIALDLDGPSVEVEPMRSWNIEQECLHGWRTFVAAKTPEASYVALNALSQQFVVEAQPTWDIADHRGPVPTTARGMARLPLDLQVSILGGWRDSYVVVAKPEPTVVDAIIPPGPMNRELKRRLRKVA